MLHFELLVSTYTCIDWHAWYLQPPDPLCLVFSNWYLVGQKLQRQRETWLVGSERERERERERGANREGERILSFVCIWLSWNLNWSDKLLLGQLCYIAIIVPTQCMWYGPVFLVRIHAFVGACLFFLFSLNNNQILY